MKLKSLFSFIVIGALLGGVGFSFLSGPGAKNPGSEGLVTASALEASAPAGKTPVVTITDIPAAERQSSAAD